MQDGGNVLEFASERLQDDREIVLAAVKRHPNDMQWASDRLKNDDKFISEVLTFSSIYCIGQTMEFMSSRIQELYDTGVLKLPQRAPMCERTSGKATNRFEHNAST